MSPTLHCLLCGTELAPFHTFERRAVFTKPMRAPEPDAVGDMLLAYCPACRHVSSRLDTAIDLAEAHERVYRELYEHYGATGLSPAQERWTDFVVDRLLSVLPARSRVLEVGSHDGYVLHRLAAHGHECVGVEPSPHGAQAQERYDDVDVVTEFFRPGLFEPGSFDAVVLRHVVEHVDTPVQFVADILETLRPGGLVYVEVPNSHGSLEEAFFPEFHADHISYFTPASLAELLHRAGIADVLHLESAWAYMRFPFLCALGRRTDDARPAFDGWFQDFRIDGVLESFRARHATYLANLRGLEHRGRLAVWGTGSIGHQYAIDAGWGDDVTYVDLSKATHGLRLSVTGHEVHPVEILADGGFDTLLLASGWEEDARRQAAEHVAPTTTIVGFSDLLEQR